MEKLDLILGLRYESIIPEYNNWTAQRKQEGKFMITDLHISKWFATDWTRILSTCVVLTAEALQATLKLCKHMIYMKKDEHYLKLIPENMLSASNDHKEVLLQDCWMWKCNHGKLDSFLPNISPCMYALKETVTCRHCNSCNGSSQCPIPSLVGRGYRKGSDIFPCYRCFTWKPSINLDLISPILNIEELTCC